jgi:hypothetical protein
MIFAKFTLFYKFLEILGKTLFSQNKCVLWAKFCYQLIKKGKKLNMHIYVFIPYLNLVYNSSNFEFWIFQKKSIVFKKKNHRNLWHKFSRIWQHCKLSHQFIFFNAATYIPLESKYIFVVVKA